jgi:hypothetical protein
MLTRVDLTISIRMEKSGMVVMVGELMGDGLKPEKRPAKPLGFIKSLIAEHIRASSYVGWPSPAISIPIAARF